MWLQRLAASLYIGTSLVGWASTSQLQTCLSHCVATSNGLCCVYQAGAPSSQKHGVQPPCNPSHSTAHHDLTPVGLPLLLLLLLLLLHALVQNLLGNLTPL